MRFRKAIDVEMDVLKGQKGSQLLPKNSLFAIDLETLNKDKLRYLD